MYASILNQMAKHSSAHRHSPITVWCLFSALYTQIHLLMMCGNRVQIIDSKILTNFRWNGLIKNLNKIQSKLCRCQYRKLPHDVNDFSMISFMLSKSITKIQLDLNRERTFSKRSITRKLKKKILIISKDVSLHLSFISLTLGLKIALDMWCTTFQGFILFLWKWLIIIQNMRFSFENTQKLLCELFDLISNAFFSH